MDLFSRSSPDTRLTPYCKQSNIHEHGIQNDRGNVFEWNEIILERGRYIREELRTKFLMWLYSTRMLV